MRKTKIIFLIATLFIFLIAVLFTRHSIFSQFRSDGLIIEKITARELTTWKTLDKGKASTEDDILFVEEVNGLDDAFFISPKSYRGDLTIRYSTKALSESSVMIMLFVASDSVEITKPFNFPKKGCCW